ncbi:MAG: cytochrome P450 [Actinobacteria bacterium]|nr:cytochrome P450 [Actinomycetota bacterium]
MRTDLYFDPYSDVFYDRPYDLYKQLRDEAPVSYNPQYNFYSLVRYADVVEASKDHETYSNRWGAAPPFLGNADSVAEGPGNMLFMDPPNHERMRKLVNRAFTPRAAQNFEHIVHRVIKEKADAIGDSKNSLSR